MNVKNIVSLESEVQKLATKFAEKSNKKKIFKSDDSLSEFGEQFNSLLTDKRMNINFGSDLEHYIFNVVGGQSKNDIAIYLINDVEGNSTMDPLAEFSLRIQDKIKAIVKRIGDKGPGDAYKIQMIGEALKFQEKFCPGGFKTDGKIGENLKAHLRDIDPKENSSGTLLDKLISSRPNKFIFSNEALQMNGPKGRLVDPNLQKRTAIEQAGSLKEKYSVTVPNRVLPSLEELKISDDRNVYLCQKNNGMNYITSHYSSIKEAERDEESDKWCANLSNLLTKMGSSGTDGTFGGFCGDINLYLENSNGFLKNGVIDALKEHNCVLFVARNRINKDVRSSIQDQWHKIKITKSNSADEEYSRDSLIVIEKFNPNIHTNEKLRELSDRMNIYCPALSVNYNNTPKNIQPFTSFNEKGKICCITDHFFVEGCILGIFSGADADGIGNKAKKFADGHKRIITSPEHKFNCLKILRQFIIGVTNYLDDIPKNYKKYFLQKVRKNNKTERNKTIKRVQHLNFLRKTKNNNNKERKNTINRMKKLGLLKGGKRSKTNKIKKTKQTKKSKTRSNFWRLW